MNRGRVFGRGFVFGGEMDRTKARTQRKLLRIPQAVEYMNGVVTAATLRQWIWLRRIEVIRVGRAVCIPADALDAIIERGTMPALER
jgi:excisionase family DNA binding protein